MIVLSLRKIALACIPLAGAYDQPVIPLVSTQDMRNLDRVTIEEIGIPSRVLMESAGRQVAERIRDLVHGEKRPVLILAGTGNNGGDAAVVARYLSHWYLPFSLWVIGKPSEYSADLQMQLDILEKLGVELQVLEDEERLPELIATAQRASWVVDGIFGSGLSRAIVGYRLDLIEALNAEKLSVLALDIASGIDGTRGGILGAALRATETLCVGYPKLGQLIYPARDYSGRMRVLDIGFPPLSKLGIRAGQTLLTSGDLAHALRPRPKDSHKGSFGRVLALAGSQDSPGAALLLGRAALRGGAGVVTLGADDETLRRIAGHLGPLMGVSLGSDRVLVPKIHTALDHADVVVAGPALAPTPSLSSLLKELFAESDKPLILDAGALTAIQTDHDWLKARPGPTVLTPHPGEAARMLGVHVQQLQEDRPGAARQLARETNAEVILKGASTLIASPGGRLSVIAAGNPGLATAGSGDVLAGLVAALMAQKMRKEAASRTAALWHGVAGDWVVKQQGQELSMTSEDLIDALVPSLAEQLKASAERRENPRQQVELYF